MQNNNLTKIGLRKGGEDMLPTKFILEFLNYGQSFKTRSPKKYFKILKCFKNFQVNLKKETGSMPLQPEI